MLRRSIGWRRAAALSITVALLLLAAPAAACGCGAHIPREGEARVGQERALIRWDGRTEDIVMELGVEGRSQEAAWIVPVPAQATVKPSVRRDCLDHLLVVSDVHLRRILAEDLSSFNRSPPHQGINQCVPECDESPTPSGGDPGTLIGCTQRILGSGWPASCLSASCVMRDKPAALWGDDLRSQHRVRFPVDDCTRYSRGGADETGRVSTGGPGI